MLEVVAASDVRGGSSIRSAAKDFGVDRMTLKRFISRVMSTPKL